MLVIRSGKESKKIKRMKRFFEVHNLKKYFPIKKGVFRRCVGNFKAVDGVSFHIEEGEVVGLVGESGSGKSTLGRACIRLIEPTAGDIFFMGADLMKASKQELRTLRQKVQIVFQDPLASLNPRKTVLENIGEALVVHHLVKNREELEHAAAHILQQVGLPASIFNQYPHQFSGGQQQRISIARALILKPKLLICDEITSALDLSVQAQVLNLLSDLKTQLKLSYLVISHDLAVIRHLCDRVLVLYKGVVVESASTEALFNTPKHPYTKQLLNSLPISHPRQRNYS
jgi:ABC-type oligopeptide transport system ATPase subunit